MGFSAPKAPAPSPPPDNSAAIAEANRQKAEAEAETKRLEEERLAANNEIITENKSRRKRSSSRFALTLSDMDGTLG